MDHYENFTYEARTENGEIKLCEPVRLPEKATVYVIVPGAEEAPKWHVTNPRLARPEQGVDFVKEVTGEPQNDAGP